ncbi:MAG: GAF domain-containing protein [Chloroflexi bacterium]|nr:GAF domain-containing protein [Chloroflexota bacterium]
MKPQLRILAAAVFGGLAVGLIDALIDYWIFYDDRSLAQLIILEVPAHEVYIRLVILAAFVFFGVVVGWIVERQQQFEHALRTSEEHFRLLYEEAPLGYHSLDAAGCLLVVNSAWLDLLGYRLEDVIGRWFGTFLAPDHREDFRANFEQFKVHGAATGVEYTMLRQDSSRVHVAIDGKVSYGPCGRFQQSHCVLQNQSRRKTAERALSREAEINAMLAELSRRMLQSATVDHIANEVLAVARQMTGSAFGYVGYIDQQTGFLVSPTLTRDIWDQCDVPDKDIVFQVFTGLFGWVLENRQSLLANDAPNHPQSSGTPPGHLPIERFLSAPALAEGELVGQIALANPPRDYTPDDLELVERLAVLYALAVQRQQIDDVLQFRLDMDRLISHISTEFINCPQDEIDQAVTQALARVGRFAGGARCVVVLFSDDLTTFSFAYEWHRPGQQPWVERVQNQSLAAFGPFFGRFQHDQVFRIDQSTPLVPATKEEAAWLALEDEHPVLFVPMASQGKLYGALGLYGGLNHSREWPVEYEALLRAVAVSVLNVLRRKWAQEALNKSEDERSLVLSSISELVAYYHTGSFQVVWANTAAGASVGKQAADLVGHYCHAIWHDSDEICDDCPVEKVFHTGQAHQSEQVSPDGRVWRLRAYPVHDNGQMVGAVEVGMDITSQQQAREALQHSQERLQVLHEIDRAILAAQAPEEIADAALAHIRRLLPCVRSSVVVFEDDGAHARILSSVTDRETELAPNRQFPAKEFYMSQGPSKGAPQMFPDVNALDVPSTLVPILRAEGVRSFMRVPLLIGDTVIGVLNLGANTPAAFTDEHVQIAQEVADQVAIVIHQARLTQQIERHAEELEQRVSERTAELHAANEQLRALSQVKDQFVSNVSHELRTPITSLKLREHLLRKQPERLDEHLTVLQRETSRLENIIESLLYLSRLDQGRFDFNPTPVDLNLLVTQYVTDRALLAESRGLTLEQQTEPELPPITVDEALIGQALSVLLTNALNYTPAGGHVMVAIQHRESDGSAWQGFSVSDTGPGIPLEEQPKLFQRFFRGEAGRTSGMPGTGLGLAIVKEIVERHQGQVDVVSAGRAGEGAAFTVWLPG